MNHIVLQGVFQGMQCLPQLIIDWIQRRRNRKFIPAVTNAKMKHSRHQRPLVVKTVRFEYTQKYFSPRANVACTTLSNSSHHCILATCNWQYMNSLLAAKVDVNDETREFSMKVQRCSGVRVLILHARWVWQISTGKPSLLKTLL